MADSLFCRHCGAKREENPRPSPDLNTFEVSYTPLSTVSRRWQAGTATPSVLVADERDLEMPCLVTPWKRL